MWSSAAWGMPSETAIASSPHWPMPQLERLDLSKVSSITLEHVTFCIDMYTIFRCHLPHDPVILCCVVSTEASEGAGRSYEATCSAGIYRVMTTCYQVTSHTHTMSPRGVLDSTEKRNIQHALF